VAAVRSADVDMWLRKEGVNGVLGRTLVREDERGKKKAGAVAMRWGVGMGQGRCHAVARHGGSVGPVWQSSGTARPAVARPQSSRSTHARAACDRR
jgi:hypothetical protein